MEMGSRGGGGVKGSAGGGRRAPPVAAMGSCWRGVKEAHQWDGCILAGGRAGFCWWWWGWSSAAVKSWCYVGKAARVPLARGSGIPSAGGRWLQWRGEGERTQHSPVEVTLFCWWRVKGGPAVGCGILSVGCEGSLYGGEWGSFDGMVTGVCCWGDEWGSKDCGGCDGVLLAGANNSVGGVRGSIVAGCGVLLAGADAIPSVGSAGFHWWAVIGVPLAGGERFRWWAVKPIHHFPPM